MDAIPTLNIADVRALIPAIRGALERNEHPRVFWDKLRQKHDVTLKQCCEHFREHHLPKLRPRTVMLYEHTMQRYFEPLFIGIPVEQIPFSSWLEWFDKIGKKKPKNEGHLLRRLKSILSFCIRRNRISGSPVSFEFHSLCPLLLMCLSGELCCISKSTLLSLKV
ncbi:hypothetical protein ACET66_09385 [Aeromonas simiae]|uniref:hypothetical protein n=1 Tax=Aeromonas simiae TaxID=218936 RepID=UPI0038D00A0F